MGKVTYWLFVLVLPLFFVSSTVCLLVNRVRVYEYSFNKYRVEEVTGIDNSQLRQVATKLIDYFNCKAETPQMTVIKNGKEIELFHDYELIHLRDVKRLVQLNYLMLGVSLTYIIVCTLVFLLQRKGPWQDLARGVIRGSIIALGLIALLGVVSVFNFEWLFVQFHRLAFHNPYWLLDPTKDCLIMMFPSGFWEDVTLVAGGIIIGKALLMGSIACFVLSIKQRQRETQPS